MRANLRHYCQSLVKIHDEDSNLVPFIWRPAQVHVHDAVERQRDATGRVRVIILKGRKLGISTYVGARFYHKTTIAPGFGQRSHIQTHADPSTQALFDIVKTMHRNMVGDFRPRASKSNKTELQFAGLSSGYVVSTAKNISGVGRGSTPHSLHASEMAFWPHAHLHLAGIINAVPDAPRSEVIIESTANGLAGAFYEQWLKAEAKQSEYLAIFIPWWWHALYRRPLDRNYEPSDEEIEYGQTYEIDEEQVCWLHYKNITMGGEPGVLCPQFKQEYPANSQEAFQGGTDDSFIRSEYVMRARHNRFEADPWAAKVLGVDMAQQGTDKTRLIDRCGSQAGHLVHEEFDNKDDDIRLANHIAQLIQFHGFQRVFMDMAPGRTLVHLLHNMGFGDIVQGVDFGGGASDAKKYMNKRAEMYGNCRDWLKQPGGADIPDDDELHRHLCAPSWRSGDNSRILLEKKDKIRERLKCSPDQADALVLTFAEIVINELPRTPSWTDELEDDYGGGFMTQ